MTVAELITKLQKIQQDLPVESAGADCGGYDVVTGENVFVEVRPSYDGRITCFIGHKEPC